MDNGSKPLVKIFALLACVLGAFALVCLRHAPGERCTGRRIAVQRLPRPVHATPGDVVRAAVTAPSAELSESDSLVRELAATLSSHPRIAAWLVNDDLVRRFVASVEDVASGYSPWQHLDFMRPTSPFRVREHQGALVITESSFHRYDRPAEVFASIDSSGAVEFYVRLKPMLEAAHREISPWNTSFDERLDEAIAHLLQVEVPDGELAVAAGTITYAYAEPALEKLTDAQRHMMRMGPRNMRLVQGKLRELQRALAALDTAAPSPPADQVARAAGGAEPDPAPMTAQVMQASWPPRPAGRPW